MDDVQLIYCKTISKLGGDTELRVYNNKKQIKSIIKFGVE